MLSFVYSYPVILSIEDHCSLPQQRKMAAAYREVFGDSLLTQPYDRNEKFMPSPAQLKRKIILKHKKLPEDDLEQTIIIKGDESTGKSCEVT